MVRRCASRPPVQDSAKETHWIQETLEPFRAVFVAVFFVSVGMLLDLDFVGAPVFEGFGAEDYDQFSQEIRLVSPGGETIDWIAGAFYQALF